MPNLNLLCRESLAAQGFDLHLRLEQSTLKKFDALNHRRLVSITRHALAPSKRVNNSETVGF
jgi:hypothetical protein